MAPRIQKRLVKKGKGKGQKITKTITINASGPSKDKIFDVAQCAKHFQDKIKVEGRLGNLGDQIIIKEDVAAGKVYITAHRELSGRYIKYLTKKFLKKQQLRDWLRVVSTSKGVYELKFFNVVNDEGDDDDDDE